METKEQIMSVVFYSNVESHSEKDLYQICTSKNKVYKMMEQYASQEVTVALAKAEEEKRKFAGEMVRQFWEEWGEDMMDENNVNDWLKENNLTE